MDDRTYIKPQAELFSSCLLPAMHTHWINLLLASGPAHSTTAVDKAVNATVTTVHTTTAHAVSQWDILRKDLGDAVHVALRPVYEWCIDDTLVPSSVPVPPFAAPTPPPSAFWEAAVVARPSSSPSSYLPESLPTSAVRFPRRIPFPTPASRLPPNAVVSGWGKWRISPPTATPSPTTSPTTDSRLGSVATPRVANSHSPVHSFMSDSVAPRLPTCRIGSFNGTEVPIPGLMCSLHDRPRTRRRSDSVLISPRLPISPFNDTKIPIHRPKTRRSVESVLIGPRLPTSLIGSFNGTELPVPGHTCSPDDRPPQPRLIWTTRPRCPFNIGNLPAHVACPIPIRLSDQQSIFLDPPTDPRDPIIDLGPILDLIPLYLESVIVPRQHLHTSQRATTSSASFYDSIWFQVGGAVLTFLFAYALYIGLPVITRHDAANIEVSEITGSRRAVAQTISPQIKAPVVDAALVSYFDIVKGMVHGLFAEISRVITRSCSFITKFVTMRLAGVIGLIISLRSFVRRVIKIVFEIVLYSGIVIYVIVRNIVRGSFKMTKGVFAYSDSRVAEHPVSPVELSTGPSNRPVTNSEIQQQPEAGPSTSRSPRLRSLPSGVAASIRVGNAATSQVRRAGGRRVNMARPVRTASSSS
ncbi:hypothetical protein H2248_002731 [Termitomyces sp. 'cryptogamus']|nr:hypothetical protein H2248_002731 [Termitomyces sp. 'cryptogamus']